MPIAKNWSNANRSHIKQNVPERGGVYELKAYGELVYIGKADNLQRRLLEHLSKNPNKYRYKRARGLFTTPTKQEKKHFDNYMQNNASKPAWNTQDPR